MKKENLRDKIVTCQTLFLFYLQNVFQVNLLFS